MNTREYKRHKGLKKENLRDNMTNTELVLNMLAEVATTDISSTRRRAGLTKVRKLPKRARKPRKSLVSKLKKAPENPLLANLTQRI